MKRAGSRSLEIEMDWSYLVELGDWSLDSPHRDVARLHSSASAILLLSYQQNIWKASMF